MKQFMNLHCCGPAVTAGYKNQSGNAV